MIKCSWFDTFETVFNPLFAWWYFPNGKIHFLVLQFSRSFTNGTVTIHYYFLFCNMDSKAQVYVIRVKNIIVKKTTQAVKHSLFTKCSCGWILWNYCDIWCWDEFQYKAITCPRSKFSHVQLLSLKQVRRRFLFCKGVQ